MVRARAGMKWTRLTQDQVRPVTDDDIGLKVLREAPAETVERTVEPIECVTP